MSEESPASRYEFKDVIADVERVFRELSPRDQFDLLAEDRESDRNRLVSDMDAAGITGDQRFAILDDFREKTKHLSDEHWGLLPLTQIGQHRIVVASLNKTYPGEGESIAKQIAWPKRRWKSESIRLAGFELATTPPATPQPQEGIGYGEGDDANPTAQGAGYGQ